MNYIELKSVSKVFRVNNQEVPALNNIDFSIMENEIIALTGRSGSGKSTIINIIAGMLRFESGKFVFNGRDITHLTDAEMLSYRRENIGMIVQNYALLEDETVFKNLALPLELRKVSKSTIKESVGEILENFGLKEKRDIAVCKLSGGQKQRVAIARAMICKPRILLADEPTAALDRDSEQEIMDWFLKINRHGTTIILVTHDRDIAKQCNRTVEILDGRFI